MSFIWSQFSALKRQPHLRIFAISFLNITCCSSQIYVRMLFLCSCPVFFKIAAKIKSGAVKSWEYEEQLKSVNLITKRSPKLFFKSAITDPSMNSGPIWLKPQLWIIFTVGLKTFSINVWYRFAFTVTDIL